MKTQSDILTLAAAVLTLSFATAVNAQNIEDLKRKLEENMKGQRQGQEQVNRYLAQPMPALGANDSRDPAFYRQKAAESRASAAEEDRQAALVGGPKSTIGPQHLQAAQALRNAAAQYDSRAASLSGGGGGTGLGSVPAFGGGTKVQQLQQFQNGLQGLADAFRAREERQEQREAAQRESDRQQAENARLERLRMDQERLRLDQERLEDAKEQFGSLSALLGGDGAGARTDSGGLASLLTDRGSLSKPTTNPAPPRTGANNDDWLVGEALLPAGASKPRPPTKTDDADWLAGSAKTGGPGGRAPSILDANSADGRDSLFKAVPESPGTTASSTTASGSGLSGLGGQLQRAADDAGVFYQNQVKPVSKHIADSLVDDVLSGKDIDLKGAAGDSLWDAAKERTIAWVRRQPFLRGKSYDDLPEDKRNDAEMLLSLDEFKARLLMRDVKGAREAYETFIDKGLNPLEKFRSEPKQ